MVETHKKELWEDRSLSRVWAMVVLPQSRERWKSPGPKQDQMCKNPRQHGEQRKSDKEAGVKLRQELLEEPADKEAREDQAGSSSEEA